MSPWCAGVKLADLGKCSPFGDASGLFESVHDASLSMIHSHSAPTASSCSRRSPPKRGTPPGLPKRSGGCSVSGPVRGATLSGPDTRGEGGGYI